MKAYIRRLAKFLLFMIVIILILLFLLPWLTRGVSFEQTFHIMAVSQRLKMILLLLIVYALIYPIINYGKKDRHISGRFEDNRSDLEEAMQELGYVKEIDDGSRLLFRRKSKISRTIMLGEDGIEIDIKSKPLVLKGPRRDLKRVDVMLDAKFLGKTQ